MDYNELLTSEQKYAAVVTATSPDELDAMWEAWSSRGWSTEGLLYSAVLMKRAELGVELSDEDLERVKRAEAARKTAPDLPPITGGKPGEG